MPAPSPRCLAIVVALFAVCHVGVAALVRYLTGTQYSPSTAYADSHVYDGLESTTDWWATLTRFSNTYSASDADREANAGAWWLYSVCAWVAHLQVVLIKPASIGAPSGARHYVFAAVFLALVGLLVNLMVTVPLPFNLDARAPTPVALIFGLNFYPAFTVFSPRLALYYYAVFWQWTNAPYDSAVKQSFYTAFSVTAPVAYATVTATSTTLSFCLAIAFAAAATLVAERVEAAVLTAGLVHETSWLFPSRGTSAPDAEPLDKSGGATSELLPVYQVGSDNDGDEEDQLDDEPGTVPTEET